MQPAKTASVLPPWNPSLDDSASAAHMILESAIDRSLGSWTSVAQGWKSAKRHLIDALDPRTGRLNSCYTYTLTETQRIDAYLRALLAVSQDETERIALYDWYSNVCRADVCTGQVSADSRLVPHCGARVGQRLGRALTAFLRSRGIDKGQRYLRPADGSNPERWVTPDLAAEVCERVVVAAQIKPRTGWITLSANILDLLTCSEGCSYSSCHALDGCYRAGPQCLVADSCTAVGYYWETTCNVRGVVVPKKLARVIVHLDSENQSAALVRRYGQSIPDDAWVALRRLVAITLYRLAGKEPGDNPRWFKTSTAGADISKDDSSLAYPDHEYCELSGCVQLRPGKKYRPSLVVGAAAPCPSCGDKLDSQSLLHCSGCNRSSRCRSCHCRVDEDDCLSDEDGLLCESCWADRYFHCDLCSEQTSRDDRVRHNDQSYCEECAAERTSCCERCDTDVWDDEQLTVNGQTLCETCADEHVRTLAQRFLDSPRYLRTHPAVRSVYAHVWAFMQPHYAVQPALSILRPLAPELQTQTV